MSLYDSVRRRVPPLKLTRDDAIELRELGDQCVQETLQQYLESHVERRGAVDKTRWKEIRHTDDLRVYTERTSSALKSTCPQGHLGESGDSQADGVRATLPPFLVTGTVVGDLEDMMYATTAPTADAMQIKSAYIDDGVVASKVLQQILSPTRNEPYRNLAVKWAMIHPTKVQSLTRPRDYTYLDSTGIVIAPSGERIGFRITHSIAFPKFPTFEQPHSVVRGSMSVCCLYRQAGPNVVECYVRGFFDLGGSIAKRLALVAVAEQASAFAKKIHCAHMKKLAWRLQSRPKDSMIGPSPCDFSSSAIGAVVALPEACKVCSRPFASSRSSLFALGPITKKCCSLCQELVCSKCRVKQRLHLIGPHRTLIHQELSFCSPCVNETVRMDAYEIAQDEFVSATTTRDTYNPRYNSSMSFTTSASSSYRDSSIGGGRHHPMLASIVSSTQSVDALEFSDEELSDDDEEPKSSFRLTTRIDPH
jgi:hypothetical protein